MKIKFLGTRGSYPSSHPGNQYLGGNTPSVVVFLNKQMLILDAGTGIMNLQRDWKEETKRIDILLSHLHIDHIQGLGFFDPFFKPEYNIHIWGPSSSTKDLRSRLGLFLSPPLFPVRLRDLPSNVIIHELADSEIEIGDFKIKTNFICHPGPTIGYLISHNNNSLAYLPDHEPALGIKNLFDDLPWLSGSDLAANADLLIHDAQYFEREYQDKIGWGHSTMRQAIRFASACNVGKLILFHHDPAKSDKEILEYFQDLKKTVNSGFTIELAREGSEFIL